MLPLREDIAGKVKPLRGRGRPTDGSSHALGARVLVLRCTGSF